MHLHNAPVYGAIDIGSNTIRAVIARCTPDELVILDSDEALVRIGESVNSTGAISPEKQELTLSTLRDYLALAHRHQAQHTFAIATEAIRKASNREEFLATIQRETGIEVHCIDGEIEAILTYFGATYDLRNTTTTPSSVGVLDLGGGSMELVLAHYSQIKWHTTLPIGSGWLHDRYLFSDPPSEEDIAAARTFLTTYFQGIQMKRLPSILLATGGSANTLLSLAQRAFNLPDHQQTLSYDDLVRCERLLCELPASEIAQRYEIDIKRARILTAGSMIIRALAERMHINELRVNTHGIREGLLLAYTRFGERWPYYIQLCAQATRSGGSASAPTFAQSGRKLLESRVRKLVEWRDEVVKNEDVEAVHKMRVASRRLRAVLDAYQPICAPRPFKKVYRSIKETADILGRARDTDVMILHLQGRLPHSSPEEQAALRWLIARLTGYRQKYQKKLSSYMKNFDEHELLQLIRQCLAEEK